MSLVYEHIAPGFQRIGPVRAFLVRVFQLRRRPLEIPVLGERDTPRVVPAAVRARGALSANQISRCTNRLNASPASRKPAKVEAI
jgi:hypothetical protein